MMQMPLLSYPQFSQFLQLQQEQQQLQQHYSRTFLPVVQTNGFGMLSHRSGTSCSEASTGSPTPSPSPPLSIASENYPSAKSSQNSRTGKSFTIDAILGIRDGEVNHRDHLNNFHPRFGLQLSSKMDIQSGYGNGLDVSATRLEACGRKMDVSRLSTVSREVLAFQLPTDLSPSRASNSASVTSRRELHQSSSFQSSACSRLSEKSTSEVSKKCNGKSKRVRTIFTPEQLERLEAEFERQQYMVGPERLYLAHTLQLTEAQVKVWFQNRRIKWRKQHLEIQQQRLAAIKQQQQRSEGDDSDDDSVDSNNYTFSNDTNDNVGNGYCKSVENNAGLESVNIMQFQVTNEEDSPNLYQKNENLSESIKSNSPGEVI